MTNSKDDLNAMAQSQTSIGRVVVASFVGTMIEWYDFFIFGMASVVVFPSLFFPNDDPFTSRMASFGTFAVGFFMRPLGGVLFGHYGDRVGRKSMLVTTLMMMGLATFLIGVLPTYEQIGVWGPLLLIVLRLVQGLGVGGEWGGAVLMAVEHGHAGRRGLYGSFVQVGVPAGLLLATLVFGVFNSVLTPEQFLSWGWRIPFLLGILLLGVGLFVRYQVFESPLFSKTQESGVSRLPILDVFRQHPGNVLLAMGARFAENACFYIFTIFVISYARDHLRLDAQVALNGVTIAAGVQILAIPLFGILSDRIGRRPVYVGGAMFVAAFSYPFFLLVETGAPIWINLAIVVALLGHSAMYGPQAAFFSELFGTRVRYSGASVGYQLASPLAGGVAPMIAAQLLSVFETSLAIAVYLMVMCLITLVSVALASETYRDNLG